MIILKMLAHIGLMILLLVAKVMFESGKAFGWMGVWLATKAAETAQYCYDTNKLLMGEKHV